MRRFVFIDWAKMIAIICVCVGHFLPAGDTVKNLLYSFHVPAFFVISGFLYNNNGKFQWNYIIKLARRVLIPYSVWFWISALFECRNVCVLLSYLPKYVFLNGSTIWNQALWFLPCFFIVSVLHYGLTVFLAKNKPIYHVLISMACLGMACCFDYLGVKESLFGANKSVFLLGVQFVGSAIRLVYSENEQGIKKTCLVGWLLFVICAVITCVANRGDRISILYSDYNNAFLYFPLSVIMSVSYLWACMCFGEDKSVSLIAKNTLPLLGGHYFILYFARMVMAREHILYLTAGLWISAVFILVLLLLNHIAGKNTKIAAFLSVFGFVW